MTRFVAVVAWDSFAAALLCEPARGASVADAFARACDAGAGIARAGGAAGAVAAR